MEGLKRQLLSLCALVEEQVDVAVRALAACDADMAVAVKERDAEVDRREVEIEEECLKILALHQPVAIDLRLVVAVLKINNDLERIGDLAVNVARKAAALAAGPPIETPFDLPAMWEKTRLMLRDSLDAFVNRDAALAESVCARDDEVDRMKHEIRRQAESMMRTQPDRLQWFLRLLAVTRNLERIADHATNIAEDVIYLIDGRIVRHGSAV
jgi:phosphate transport system protein